VTIGDTVELAYVDQSRDTLDSEASVYEEITGGVDHMKVVEGLGCKAIRVRKQEEITPAIERAEALMAEFGVPVVIEVMLERVTNIAMGTEIDSVNEFEPLAEGVEDAPTALAVATWAIRRGTTPVVAIRVQKVHPRPVSSDERHDVLVRVVRVSRRTDRNMVFLSGAVKLSACMHATKPRLLVRAGSRLTARASKRSRRAAPAAAWRRRARAGTMANPGKTIRTSRSTLDDLRLRSQRPASRVPRPAFRLPHPPSRLTHPH
jgi:hypothetical protein